MTNEVEFTRVKQFGIIKLNRDSALNALSLSMIVAMHLHLEQWQNLEDLKAVIIKANDASKAFCAGGDIRWLYNAGVYKDPALLEFFKKEYQLNNFINKYKKPYIALMNGITMGGGVGISLHASFPIASEKFSFAMPETGIGFFPDIGASYILSRLKNNYGFYLGLTGKRIGAELALKLGLIKYIIPSVQFNQLYNELIELDIFEDSFNKLTHFFKSKCISYSLESSVEDKLIEEAFSFQTLDETINFLQTSNNQFYKELLSELELKSPLSLYITFEQLKRAKALTLEECLKMDLNLVKHFMQDKDFYEGVRALLIDKDKQPKWQPKSLNTVDKQKIASYFN